MPLFFRVLHLPSLSVLSLTLLLGACVTLPDSTPNPFSLPTAARPYHQAIDIAGRLSVRYQRDGNEESLHGSFYWEQSSDSTIVTLLSPLGQTLARIDITPRTATLLQPGQAPRMARDVDTLTAATLGWPLPVSGLQNWLQGFASSAASPTLQQVPVKNTEIRTADGWRLHYVTWHEENPPHPRRIDLERHTEQAGKVHLRIVVDRWQPRG